VGQIETQALGMRQPGLPVAVATERDGIATCSQVDGQDQAKQPTGCHVAPAVGDVDESLSAHGFLG
jgi:hypothetical protein